MKFQICRPVSSEEENQIMDYCMWSLERARERNDPWSVHFWLNDTTFLELLTQRDEVYQRRVHIARTWLLENECGRHHPSKGAKEAAT